MYRSPIQKALLNVQWILKKFKKEKVNNQQPRSIGKAAQERGGDDLEDRGSIPAGI
jgi:hypothetical protein